MKRILLVVSALAASWFLSACGTSTQKPKTVSKEKNESSSSRLKTSRPDLAQVPTWSEKDLDFFLHGSMSTEVVPEKVLRAFIRIYPDLFPRADLSHLGLIPDPAFGWP